MRRTVPRKGRHTLEHTVVCFGIGRKEDVAKTREPERMRRGERDRAGFSRRKVSRVKKKVEPVRRFSWGKGKNWTFC